MVKTEISEIIKEDILGVDVSAITMSDALEMIGKWVRQDAPQYICCVPAHSIMEAQDCPGLIEVFNSSGMNTPDGMSIVWILHRKGHKNVQRVYGPDLLIAACQDGLVRGYRHYFYGGEVQVVSSLVERLQARFPGIQITGWHSPPFQTLSIAEEEEDIQRIRSASPDIVWVGLGSPRQEQWMYDHAKLLNDPVLIGVGAAFDFISGFKPQAPVWIQRAGLEWLFRLVNEPGRLWKRYIHYPRFIWLILTRVFLK